MQFKHINLCANDINDESKDQLAALIRRTNDDFGVTLAGNPLQKQTVDSLMKVAAEVHS